MMEKNRELELITIGIPTYNTPIAFFDLVLKQLLSQTYTNLDILIVDDGSEKEFLLHLQEIGKIDSRIRVLKKNKNDGIYITREIILQNIKGVYFTFVDSDDYIPLDYIEKLYKTIKKYNDKSVFVYCDYSTFYEDVPVTKRPSIEEEQVFERDVLFRGLTSQLGHQIYTRLIPANLLNNIKLKIEDGFDDAQLVAIICQRASKVIRINSTHYYYRQRGGSIMHSNNQSLMQAFKTYVAYLDIAEKDCKEAIPYLKIMIAFQDLKLCCVDYNETHSGKMIKSKAKALKGIIKQYGYANITGEKKQIRFAVHFPRTFSILYKHKRKKIHR